MINKKELDIIWDALNEYQNNHNFSEVDIKDIFYKLSNKTPTEEKYIERMKWFDGICTEKAVKLNKIESLIDELSDIIKK